MALTNTTPIKRAIVQKVRAASPIRSQLRGGIHERVASRRVKYPYLTYTEVSAPIITDWGGDGNAGTREIRALYDISALASNQVEAENLDELLDQLFSDNRSLEGVLEGQTCIFLSRVASLPDGGPDRDAAGRYYVRKGGTYEIHTVQPIPIT